jgi:hypothetical protein
MAAPQVIRLTVFVNCSHPFLTSTVVFVQLPGTWKIKKTTALIVTSVLSYYILKKLKSGPIIYTFYIFYIFFLISEDGGMKIKS